MVRELNPIQLYTVAELAKTLKISESSLRDMVYHKKIPFVEINNRIQFCGWQIKDWLEARTTR